MQSRDLFLFFVEMWFTLSKMVCFESVIAIINYHQATLIVTTYLIFSLQYKPYFWGPTKKLSIRKTYVHYRI